MNPKKTIIIAIAFFGMHLTATPALAEVECEGVKQTPLHNAIDAGDYEEARKMIAAKNRQNVNVIAEYKVEYSEGDWEKFCYAPLHRAAQRSDVEWEFIDALIKAGADVNMKGGYGQTPLHEVGRAETAQALITAGADVNAKNDYGRTPLHSAAGRNNTKTAEVLINAGADVNAKDENDGATPLHEAVQFAGNTEIAQVLFSAGTDVNAKNNRNQTPLHLAATYGRKEIAEALIVAGADVNVTDNDGKTPLHDAITFGGYTEIPQTLIAAGANLNARDNRDSIPLHLAAAFGRKEIVEALIAAGADVKAKNGFKETPLDLADYNTAQILHAAGAKCNRKHEGKRKEWCKGKF